MDGANGMFIAKAAAFIGAAFTMGIGTMGPALSQGSIGRQACESIGKYPDSANKVRLTMMIALGLVESLAIYCFLIALMLIFFNQ
jgi:F-type H+-transporting ATPase subunit c